MTVNSRNIKIKINNGVEVLNFIKTVIIINTDRTKGNETISIIFFINYPAQAKFKDIFFIIINMRICNFSLLFAQINLQNFKYPTIIEKDVLLN